MATVAERVAAGAALLDERWPGWWERINLDELDMASECGCVLGQIIGEEEGAHADYFTACVELGVRPWGRSVAALGYQVEPALISGRDDPRPRYDELAAAWRELIESRRAGAS